MTFPDVDRALTYLLAPLVGGLTKAGTETPADLQQRLNYIRIGRTGGPDDGTSDFPTVEIDYFAATRADAVAGSEAVRDLLTVPDYHCVTTPTGGVLLDDVTTLVGPRETPWLATGVRRYTGTYRVTLRRH